MQPDIQTIFLANAIVGFVVAIAVAIVGVRRKPELMLWSAAMALLGLTYVLFSLRGQIADYLSIVLANVALSTLLAFVAEALFVFLRRPPQRWLIWTPVVLTALGFTWWIDDFQSRLTLSSALIASQAALLVVFIARHRQQIVGRGLYIYTGGAFVVALMHLTKLVVVSIQPISQDAFLAPTLSNAFGHLVAIVAVITMIIGFLLMTWERDERTIKESELRMRTLFDATSDAMVILDASAFIDCNPATLQFFGCPNKADFLRLNPADLSPPVQPDGSDSAVLATQHIAQAMRDSFNRFDWVHKRLDTGATVEAEVLLHAIRIDGRDALLAVLRDISARKAHQLELERRVLARTEELATARNEAEAANAVKTRFMDNVSHQMRTPMMGILGFAKVGKGKVGKASDAVIVDLFDKIHESGLRLHNLNESLLSLASNARDAQTGEAASDFEPIMPELWLAECVQSAEKTARSRQQEICLENQSTVASIEGDPVRLRQVMDYLLSNAMRYSPPESRITVRLEDVPAGAATPTKIRVQVIDQGCGVPEKEMKAIFEPFYESTRTASGAGGVGLGLSLCKSIVQRHKGSISVSNRPEGGAIFEIVLPLVQA